MSTKPEDEDSLLDADFDDDMDGIASDPTRIVKEHESSITRQKRIIPQYNFKKREEEMIEAIDDLRAMKSLGPIALKLQKKKMTLEQAIKQVSNDSFLMLMKMAFSQDTNQKVKLEAFKHMLALAGYNPAQKHQIERIDSETPREALLAMISGAEKDLKKEGIEIVDDRKPKETKEQRLERLAKIKMAKEDEEYDYRDYEVEPGEAESIDEGRTFGDSSASSGFEEGAEE